jgi:acyl-CoA hydrolase
MSLEPRTTAWSATTISQVLRPEQANIFATLHGGEFVKLMDTSAGICALRHADAPVATKAIRRVIFHQPGYVGDLAVCRSRLTFVRHKVMEIWVEFHTRRPESEDLALCASGFFYYVALDTVSRQTLLVPPLQLNGEAEIAAAQQGAQRLEELLSAH